MCHVCRKDVRYVDCVAVAAFFTITIMSLISFLLAGTCGASQAGSNTGTGEHSPDGKFF